MLFAHLDEGKQPGAAVIVIDGGEIVYRRGFGFADLKEERRIDENSMFRLGSVSKQFTAAAIQVLAEQGKLHIDDPIVKYLPEQTKYPGVTIRHLLTHTSGIPDYYDDIQATEHLLSNADVAEFIAGMTGPDFPPGDRYEYSNPAYELLPLIIEAASGERFARFMEKHIFTPAGMNGALIHDHSAPDIPHRVYGYDKVDDGYARNDDHFLNGIVGSGSMYATLNDFFAWDQALYGDSVLSRDSLDEAWTPAALNNGDKIEYGYGWTLDTYEGYERVSHGGSWVGFRNGIARYPEQQLAIVVLTNGSWFEPELAIDRISEIYLPADPARFRPAASFERVQRQHRRLPDNDIWWTVNGPDMAWNNKNLHQLFPTVNVYRNGPVRELAASSSNEIAEIVVETPAGKMSFDDFIHSDHSTLMGIVVLHEGRIVYERYPRMQDYEMPVYWSVAKAFVGTVVRILEERGQIDVSAQIENYIPELAESSFAGITVRNILDMATGLDCDDEYEDRDSCYYRYSMAIGDGFRSEDAPDNPYDFVATLEVSRHAEQGERFSYSGLNTFVLAWLVEKVTGTPFQDAFSREIWYHIGAESNASYIAPRYGVAVTHGGFMARLRDVARFGLLFTPSYKVVSDTRIISDAHLELLQNGG
ncbi:MAG: beta-lactamase family protein, partial [Gammaproteobacteria bacterium]|nr:beta-lactamase family protein [Gammaproteobacteria bacterium]